MKKSIIDINSKVSFLQQRLDYAKEHVSDPIYLAENVPIWPDNSFSTNYLPKNLDVFLKNYSTPHGERELVNQLLIREFQCYSTKLAQENIIITNGAQNAINLIANKEYVHGAEIICQAPILKTISDTFIDIGFNLKCIYKDNYEQDFLEQLRHNTNPNTRILYLNSPHNPTGNILDSKDLKEVTHYCQKNNIIIIFDAVYDSFNFSNKILKLPLNFTNDWSKIYVVNSVSKSFGTPGLRIGWLISDKQNTLDLAAYLETQCISISTSNQHIAANLIEFGNIPLQLKLRDNFKKINELLLSYFSSDSFSFPEGGTQFILYLPISNIEDFADEILLKHKIVLTTSSNYYGNTKGFIRLPLGNSIRTLELALPLILETLKNFTYTYSKV